MSHGLFITGTDTDVGKTYVTGCIGLTLTQQGVAVSPRKPIASGCIRQMDGSLLSEDALYIQQACSSLELLSTICPHTYEPAISPQRALQQAGHLINTHDLLPACRPLDNHIALVEGAGGFYSPLATDGLNADLAKALNFPVVLVVGNKLGCINHALLTIAAIEAANLELHSVIVNDLQQDADIENFKEIKARLAPYSISCFHLPYSANFSVSLLTNFHL